MSPGAATLEGLLARIDPAAPLGLLLDFDGTLAEIVARPELARPRPRAREALCRLAARPDVRVAVISGRCLDDLTGRLGPIPGLWLSGPHGAEVEDPSGRREPLIDYAAARPAMEAFLASACALEPALLLEDKGAAVAVHLRGLPAESATLVAPALTARARALCAVAPVGFMVGKAVLELRARGIGKGAGGRALLERWRPAPRQLLAAGDDTTDEELFAEVLSRGGLALKIGPGESRASHRLPDPAALEGLLVALADR